MTPVPIRLDQRPGTLHEQIRYLVTERAQETCVVLIDHSGEHPISYEEFFAQAGRYAAAMQAAGIASGDLVVLVIPHSADLLYSFWGAVMMGAVPSIFAYLSDKQDRARYLKDVRQLVEKSAAKAVVTADEFEQTLRETLSGTNAALLPLGDMQPGAALPAYGDLRAARHPGDTAFLQHSSGSTGLQKGVMLSHGAVLNQIASYSAAIGLAAEDVVVSWLPLYHDMGLIAGFIMPLMQGLKLVLMSPFHWVRDPKILLWAIHRHRGTLCWLPNFAYNFLATRIRDADLQGLDLASMRGFINCSEPIYAPSHQLFLERFQPYGLRADALWTCYAMAENTFAVTQGGVDGPVALDVVDRRILAEQHRAVMAQNGAPGVTLVSCGKAIPNCQVRVVGADGQPLPGRHIGEIALRSDSMLSGYYRRPELTQEAIAEGWYFTGDMGYLADGELYITGRRKDLIIVGGKNVYPQDIENLLNDIEGVHPGRTVAFGILNEQLGTEDIAVIAEVDTEDDERRSAITREIRTRIAQNTEVTARYVHTVDARWLIKTSSGKVARSANREKFIREVLNT